MFNKDLINLEIDNICPIFITLPPSNIVLLKCLIESYEGIAEIRTLDKNKALMVILAMNDTANTVMNLLNSEKESLSWNRSTPPNKLDGDWLLSDIKST